MDYILEIVTKEELSLRSFSFNIHIALNFLLDCFSFP